MSAFFKKFTASIVATLCCFDRVIFKGYLPFGDDAHLNAFVDHGLHIRRKDFIPMLKEHSETLVGHAKALAERAGRPYEYFQGKFRKEVFIQNLIRHDAVGNGLVAVLCCQETCRTVKLRYGNGRPHLQFAYRPQRVLYYYSIDPEFGLMHVRIQTWFPYTVQIYVNGHDWLACQMNKKRIGFCQRDNAFTQLDDPKKAQQLADRFSRLPWVRQLNRWVRQGALKVLPVHRLCRILCRPVRKRTFFPRISRAVLLQSGVPGRYSVRQPLCVRASGRFDHGKNPNLDGVRKICSESHEPFQRRVTCAPSTDRCF